MVGLISSCSRLAIWQNAARALVAVVAGACVGCGSSDLIPATGQVLYKGQPAAGATLHFHRQGVDDAKHRGLIPSAITDEDGRFRVSSDTLGAGAPAGRYAVLITWPVDLNEDNPPPTKKARTISSNSDFKRTPTDRLKGRYANAEKPHFFAEVGLGAGEIPPFQIND